MKRSKNFGKYGLINLSDLVIHKMEFNAWFTEVKKKSLKDINKKNEREYYSEFISLYNNGNLPHKKYYDIIKYTKKQNDNMLKKKRGIKRKSFVHESKFIFDDEGKKEKEKKLLKELEQKKKLDEAIYTMNKEKAEAMRERELKENLMRYYYQTSNINAALNLHKEVFESNNQKKTKIKFDSDDDIE